VDISEIWVDRKNFNRTKSVTADLGPLIAGDIRVCIDKFGITANNVSYALSGDTIGYWQFFPADENWGKVPVWGIAEVIESNNSDIEPGERLYGFFPMASHFDLTPGNVKAGAFEDVAVHRQPLPTLYNEYHRTRAEPDYLKALEDERCLLFPLFMTAFVLGDYLDDNNFFGAEQIVIGSVSSKTGLGLAAVLKDVVNYSGRVIGLTSPANLKFVEGLGDCDEIITYGNESQINNDAKTVLVDMSGSGEMVRNVHHRLNDNVVQSIGVGATHWDEDRSQTSLPGSKPEFFFAPGHIAKRNEDWGHGVIFEKANASNARIASKIKGQLEIEYFSGVGSVGEVWKDMLNNKVPGSTGVIACVGLSC